ncbi:substrate-binding domain-containing protein [Lichenifustis flavocetrariae]|uniref:Substrate-binding domain-containing protein n=1 Tax=Lichenifustis flavocetrariae TaxID=2949735 RepID=A0AA41YSQ8_9HYPH|nr:substrate-binding domain-containing protein [Lichenifustis flavocetrariae]MCW6507464.1 substrate-binding domain-containing protein [Lichenifustis flavocetrariae]
MKVGLLHPRSGIAGIWAPSMDASAILGAIEINAGGGILGDTIELVFGDCGFTPGEAVAAADALVEIEGSDVIIGGHPSNLRDAVSRRIAGKVPYIYTPQYEGIACGPSTIAIGSTDAELMAPALQWLRDEKGAERFYFIGNDYIWPHTAFTTTQRLIARQGGHLVGHTFVPTCAGHDYDILKTIAKSGAQVVVQALVGQCAIDFNRAFAAAGLDEKMLRFGLIIDETVICGIGADASVNLFTAAHYFADRHSRCNDSFLERYHDAFGEWAPPVSAASVSFYEGLHVLAGLAGKLGSRKGQDLARYLNGPISRPAVRTVLANKPVGRSPSVYLGRADGVKIEVIAAF